MTSAFFLGLVTGVLLAATAGYFAVIRRPRLAAVLDPLEVWSIFRAIRRIDQNLAEALRPDGRAGRNRNGGL